MSIIYKRPVENTITWERVFLGSIDFHYTTAARIALCFVNSIIIYILIEQHLVYVPRGMRKIKYQLLYFE